MKKITEAQSRMIRALGEGKTLVNRHGFIWWEPWEGVRSPNWNTLKALIWRELVGKGDQEKGWYSEGQTFRLTEEGKEVFEKLKGCE